MKDIRASLLRARAFGLRVPLPTPIVSSAEKTALDAALVAERVKTAKSGRRTATGHRLGEWHHRAKLADADVKKMRALHRPENPAEAMGYASLGQAFGCGTSTARDICTFRTRIDV